MGARRRLSVAGLVWVCVLVFGVGSALAVTRHVLSSSFGSFTGPVGAGVDRVSGDIYVADAEAFGVDRFAGSGEALSPARLKGQSFEEAYGLAVDNSGGLTQGDVYVADYAGGVVDKFNAGGEYLAQIAAPSHPAGVAVDGEGNVYVADLESGVVDKFNDAGEPDPGNPLITGLSSPTALAVNGAGHIFAATAGGTIEFDSAGVCVQSECAALDPAGASGVAVDGAGNVFADDGTSIAEYSSGGSLVERFGEGQLSGAYGVAVNGAKVYVADYAAKTADIFTEVLLPDPVTGEATGVSASGVVLHGTVNPDGVEATCQFEYGVEETYGSSASCSEGAGSGSSPVPVLAELTGLEPNRIYHYRLSASNENGSNPGLDGTFTTHAVAPTVSGTSMSNIASTSVTLNAQVNPNGSDTTYYFQYGPTASYGTSLPTPPGTDIGSGREAQAVSVHVQGLQASTLYHYRVVAVDSAGLSEGSDRTFTTQALGVSFALPDNRAYEFVSPAEKGGGDIQPEGEKLSEVLPSQSSLDGDAIAYVSRTLVPGAHASFLENDYLSSRTAGGWSTQAIDPPQFNERTNVIFDTGSFRVFSPDLSRSVVVAENSPVVNGAPREQNNVYLRDNASGAYQLLTHTASTSGGHFVEVDGVSADLSHITFETEQQLTPDALPGIDLYEESGGEVRLVSILPDGTPVKGGLGAAGTGQIQYVSHAVSADGSRVFWRSTGAGPGVLYVREDGVSTVQISSGDAEFEGASNDGSKVIFIEGGELYEYDLDTAHKTALAPAGAVSGASEDLAYIYILGGGNGLEVLHDSGGSWTKTFIATLSGSDLRDWGEGDNDLTRRTAEVAPDGRSIVFMSVNSLTGYENAGVSEVYLYDASADALTCVSCNPNGVPPSGASKIPVGYRNVFQARYLSDDGSRVFFDSVDALVPGDGNGLKDVYEWERDGTGSCRSAGGCVFLISGARSGFEATFADASASGNDVFFKSRAQLVAGDRDQNVDMYDARVGGGFVEPIGVTAPCVGGACRAPAGSAPVLGAPLSASFAGAGNVAVSGSVPAVKAKPKAKPKRKAKKRKRRRGREGKAARRRGVGRSLSGARVRRSS